MAELVQNKKGFKVLKMRLDEVNRVGGLCICDFCNTASVEGYYISVLNMWYCPKCYDEWYLSAKYYKEDADVENRNFNRMKEMLDR